MGNQEKTTFKLKEISNWQLDPDKSKVELPALQRGFVWKVSQIESLWDSLLRGFPIGSFLLSEREDKKLFLLDGQQRATSIALGFYDPWNQEKDGKFWSIKNIPVVWIDLSPKEKTNTQKFVIRVVTRSHPWGYQRKDNNSILTVSDRRKALSIYTDNKSGEYFDLSPLKIFPYDADLPVPLSFVLKAIFENAEDNGNWKEALIQMCEKNLPANLKTKYFGDDTKNYLVRLAETIRNEEFGALFNTIKKIEQIEIPRIVVEQEILKAEDDQPGEDPTLFVRLNSSGTRIAGEELIYSIYKASFPKAKELVEHIGANFVAPSMVISLVSRLAMSEINGGDYPKELNVNDFRKIIKDKEFKDKLKELIEGTESMIPSEKLFKQAFDLLLSKDEFQIPPALVKNFVKNSPDLFLLLLQWLKVNGRQEAKEEGRKVLATITALSWFGKDNARYVRELWGKIPSSEFWSKEILSIPYLNKKDFIMYPLIQPEMLRGYLLQNVVENSVHWDKLYPDSESEIVKTYKNIFGQASEPLESENAARIVWESFITKLFHCKSIILFAQREYINEKFKDFNQMENLEDTNVPWDWDHIYPASWVYKNRYIDHNTRHWTNSIGNFRALSLEENRSENNSLSPEKRLASVKQQSFIKENDWEFWAKIESRINEGDKEMIKNHLRAVIHRLCNIYKEWYSTLNVGELFDFENKII